MTVTMCCLPAGPKGLIIKLSHFPGFGSHSSYLCNILHQLLLLRLADFLGCDLICFGLPQSLGSINQIQHVILSKYNCFPTMNPVTILTLLFFLCILL